MAAIDKAKNSTAELKGKLKAVAGEATGNDDLRAEGENEQSLANLKQAGEKVKDTFKK